MSTILEESQKEQDIEVLVAERKYLRKEIKNCKKKIGVIQKYLNQCYINIIKTTEKLDEMKK